MNMRFGVGAAIAVGLIYVGAAQAEDQKAPVAVKAPAIMGMAMTNAAGGPMPFPPITPITNVAPEELQRVMKMRSRVEELNRALIARRNLIFAENEEIKRLQTEMREIQKKIDAVLDSDPELNELKKELDSMRKEQHVPMPVAGRAGDDGKTAKPNALPDKAAQPAGSDKPAKEK